MLPSFEDSEETNKDPEPPAPGVNHGRGLFRELWIQSEFLKKSENKTKQNDANSFLDTSGTFIALHNKSNQ